MDQFQLIYNLQYIQVIDQWKKKNNIKCQDSMKSTFCKDEKKFIDYKKLVPKMPKII